MKQEKCNVELHSSECIIKNNSHTLGKNDKVTSFNILCLSPQTLPSSVGFHPQPPCCLCLSLDLCLQCETWLTFCFFSFPSLPLWVWEGRLFFCLREHGMEREREIDREMEGWGVGAPLQSSSPAGKGLSQVLWGMQAGGRRKGSCCLSYNPPFIYTPPTALSKLNTHFPREQGNWI